MPSVEPLTPGSCPNCAAGLVPGAVFCWACGVRLADGATPTFAPLDGDSDTLAATPVPASIASALWASIDGRSQAPGGAGSSGRRPTAGLLGVGQEFGARYLIIKTLGAGGMGAVYQAWDRELGVAVALKVIRPEVMADPSGAKELERRFKRELLLARQVTHRHVVRIHDLGEVEGTKYITMPYVEGEDLASTLRREGKLPVPRVLQLARQITSGLCAAHEAGVVHRDLKPANIMLEQDGNALLMDFGIAVSTAPGATVRPPASPAGTPSVGRGSGAAIVGSGDATTISEAAVTSLGGATTFVETAGETLSDADATLAPTADETRLGGPAVRTPSSVRPTSGGTILSTRAGGIVGTLEYMSPEQARGAPADQRADIYALGLILSDLLLGPRRLEPGTTPVQAMLTRVAQAPQPLRERAPEIPEAVDALITRCLQVDPEARFQTSAELAAALARLDDQGHVIPEPRRFTRRTLAAAATLVLGLVAGTYWLARTPPQPVQPDPVSVLIAGFDNQTNDPVFNGLIEQALGVGIETASFIVNYPQRDALRAAAQLPGGTLSLDNARLISLREDVNVVLTGGIARDGDGFTITVRAIRPSTQEEETLFAMETTVASRDDVLPGVARLAARVRTELGDTTVEGDRLQESETFTAASLEAAQAYTQGQALFAAGKFAEAIEAYQGAVTLDPNLGRAWAGIGAASNNLGRQDDAKRYYEEALARIDRMTDREKHRTRGGYFLLTRNATKAKEEYGALVNAFPADPTGWANLALSSFYERDMARALLLGQRASAIFPKNALRRNNVALYAMYAGDFVTAEKEAREVLAVNPDFAKAHLAIGLSQVATGKMAEAKETFERLAGTTGANHVLGLLGLADAALYEGRAADAVAVLEAEIETARAGKAASLPRLLVTLAEARRDQGRVAEAVKLAEEAVRDTRDVAVLVMAARLLIGADRVPRALELAKALDRPLEPEALAAARLIEAEAALAQGFASEALTKLQESRKLADLWLTRFAMARAYLSLGAFVEASSELDVVLKRKGEATAAFLDDVPTYRYLPPALYHTALAQEGLRSPAAKETYAAFLDIKKNGDGRDSLVADARRRLAALK